MNDNIDTRVWAAPAGYNPESVIDVVTVENPLPGTVDAERTAKQLYLYADTFDDALDPETEPRGPLARAKEVFWAVAGVPEQHRRKAKAGALAFALVAGVAFGAATIADQRFKREYEQSQELKEEIDPVMLEFANEMRMLYEDIAKDPFTHTRASLDNVDRYSVIETGDGTMTINESVEARRTTLEAEYDYIENPDGTFTEVLKGYYTPEDAGRIITIVYRADEGKSLRIGQTNAASYTIHVFYDPNKKEKIRKVSIWISKGGNNNSNDIYISRGSDGEENATYDNGKYTDLPSSTGIDIAKSIEAHLKTFTSSSD